MTDEDVLIHADEQGSWGWAGFRLAPALGIDATNNFADFDRSVREERAADAETAWLAAQWGVHWDPRWGPGGAGRFEIRYRNDPAAGDGLVRCACLCRVRAGSAQAAVYQARAYRDGLASGLPGHVRSETLVGAADVHGWLVPFESQGAGESQVEVVKKVSWQRTVRQDAGRNVTVLVSRLTARRVPWEPLLRQLGALPFPAVLTIGFEPFPRTPAFRAGLEQLSARYAMIARPAQGSPLYSVSLPPDPFAGQAAQRYARYAQQYDAPAFRVRISLAGRQELPPQLGTWLAAALGDAGPESGGTGATALHPVMHERSAAWTNVATLGASWLSDTYRGPLPESALGPLERELLNLVDLAEARALIQLPISWPGHPELFAGPVDEPARAVDEAVNDDPWADEAAVSQPIGDPALQHRLNTMRTGQGTEVIVAGYEFAATQDGTAAQEDLSSLDRWFNDRAELDADVELRMRPPGRGEMGAQPEAVVIIASAVPVARAYFAWLREKVRHRPVSMTIVDKERGKTLTIRAGNSKEAERLLPDIKDFFQDPDA